MESADYTDFGSDGTPRNDQFGDGDGREVCRDFTRNVCNKGSKCKYKHPQKDYVAEMDQKSVCHDFQNRKGCHREFCRYVHVTVEEEAYIRENGQLPESMDYVRRESLTGEQRPMCTDFVKGRCRRGDRCKFRHSGPPGGGPPGPGGPFQDGPGPGPYGGRFDPYARDREMRRAGMREDILEDEVYYLRSQCARLKRQMMDLQTMNEELMTENQQLRKRAMANMDGDIYSGTRPSAAANSRY